MARFWQRMGLLGALLASAFWFSNALDVGSGATAFVALAALITFELLQIKSDPDPDRDLFTKFLRVLPYEGAIRLLESRPLQDGSFDAAIFNPLYDFAQGWNDAIHEFRRSSLEKRKKALQAVALEFADAMGDHSFPVQGNPNRQEIPREWRQGDPARFKQATDELSDLARRVVAAYHDFVRMARRKLKM